MKAIIARSPGKFVIATAAFLFGLASIGFGIASIYKVNFMGEFAHVFGVGSADLVVGLFSIGGLFLIVGLVTGLVNLYSGHEKPQAAPVVAELPVAPVEVEAEAVQAPEAKAEDVQPKAAARAEAGKLVSRALEGGKAQAAASPASPAAQEQEGEKAALASPRGRYCGVNSPQAERVGNPAGVRYQSLLAKVVSSSTMRTFILTLPQENI